MQPPKTQHCIGVYDFYGKGSNWLWSTQGQSCFRSFFRQVNPTFLLFVYTVNPGCLALVNVVPSGC